MKGIASFLRSFQFRVTGLLVLAMGCVVILGYGFFQQFTARTQFETFRENLMTIARIAATAIDAQTLGSIPLERSGAETLAYQEMTNKLNEIARQDPLIADIYTMAPTGSAGVWQFIVDPDPNLTRLRGVTSFPGDKYNIARFPEMVKGLEGAAADTKLEKDEWGLTLSGYAPIRDAQGKTIAVLGVDMNASDLFAAQRALRDRMIFILIFGILLSLALGTLFSGWIVRPVQELVEGTRRIGRGDLVHQVRVAVRDEIGELAEAFNRMAQDLRTSQEEREAYFYSVIQSMVRIEEAKDTYTRGHSERVAVYSVMTGAEMGYSEDVLEMLRNTAVLHDIGKLSVHDEVLNKKGALTEEEWEGIRRHPLVGEDILRPVILDPQMLSMIRHHYERFDGRGYPDGLKGSEISELSQILSVADAYDAMTSSRAYRDALPTEEAIKELVHSKGTQFQPEVVDAFLRALGKDQQVGA